MMSKNTRNAIGGGSIGMASSAFFSPFFTPSDGKGEKNSEFDIIENLLGGLLIQPVLGVCVHECASVYFFCWPCKNVSLITRRIEFCILRVPVFCFFA